MSGSCFRLEWEWLAAEHVPVASHARTWARLTIHVGDACATRVADPHTQTVRDGIRVPLMPLAEWVVCNWWYLLHESPRAHPLRAARRASAESRDWHHRHNLLFAREGFPMCDLTVARANADHAVVKVVPDPRPIGRYPVRFIEDHEQLVPRVEVRQELQRLVAAVLERLEGCEARDALELAEDWSAIQTMTGEDRLLRERAGALGLDGDDPSVVDDQTAEALVTDLSALPEVLVDDLLEVPMSAGELPGHLAWIDRVRSGSAITSGSSSVDLEEGRRAVASLRDEAATKPAYWLGWEMAARAREGLLGLDSRAHGAPLDEALARWVHALADGDEPDPRFLRGWVRSEDRVSVVLRPVHRPTERFLMARAWCLGLLGGSERLITDAQTWNQAVCRAFATELVAPRDYLRGRVGGPTVSEAQLDELAAELGAPRRAIEHQLENHELAIVE